MPSSNAESTLRRLMVSWLDLVYPRECISCGVVISAGDNACLCDECLRMMPCMGIWQCPKCGEEIGPYSASREACPSCYRRQGLSFCGSVAACRYESSAREVIHHLKYKSDLRPVGWMCDLMAQRLTRRTWYEHLGVVVPVPLHWSRRLLRRFNQSELLARGIARRCGLPLGVRVLRRTRRTEPQALLTPSLRNENVHGAFRVVDRDEICGRVVLLVDDVMTTCATAEECSRVLLKAGAKSVYVAVFAR